MEFRPLYRHVVVSRRASYETVASPENLQRIRAQYESNSPIDADLQHLYVSDSLPKTMKNVMKWAGHGDVSVEPHSEGFDLTGNAGALLDEAAAMKERGDERVTLQYRPQDAVIVSRLVSAQIPGGDEPLPSTATLWTLPGPRDGDNIESLFMDCALQMQRRFQEHSDRQFMLLDEEMRQAVTLVTVCLTPITAKPQEIQGIDLFCEFHQTTRFGYVDTEGFEVLSETGVFPISPPTSMDMMLMMQPMERV